MPRIRPDTTPSPRACPAWCDRDHAPEDHPEDGLHQSPPLYTVLVTPSQWPPGHAPGHRASPVVARLMQHPDSSEVWIDVAGEEDDLRLVVSAESGHRLGELLETMLRCLRE